MSRPKDCGEWDNYPQLKRNDEMTAEERNKVQKEAESAKHRLEKEFGIKISVAGIVD